MKLTPLTCSPRRSSAFTLMEVTVAMAIGATVLVALMALLPMSISQMQESRRMTSVARITEDIISSVQLMKWEDMEELDGEIRHYDDQGTRVRDVGVDAWQRTYSAEIDVDLEGIIVPGETEERNDFARRVTIYVGRTRGEMVNMKMLAESEKEADRYEKIPTVIARLDEQQKRR